MGGDNWVGEHGGREVHRKLVDGMLSELLFARGSDWLELLKFPEKAKEWTDADETVLRKALNKYIKDGVSAEKHECTTLDEMTELRESLGQLETVYGLDFHAAIELLEEAIAEREEPEDRDSGSRWVPSSTASMFQNVVTDEDVRQMFSTLGGS